MSRDTLSILKRHLNEKKRSVVENIIQEHLYLDMYEGVARNKQQIDATSGAMIGEASRAGKIFFFQKVFLCFSILKFSRL